MDVYWDARFGDRSDIALFGALSAQPDVGLHSFGWVYHGNFGEETLTRNGRIFQAASSVRLTQAVTTSTAGEPTRFTATVKGSGDGGSDFPSLPSGTVEILDGGSVINIAYAVDGVAVADLVLDGAYEHQLTARYSGDHNFAAPGDLAPPIQHTITKATAFNALGQSPNATTLAGQEVTFTSTLTPTSSTNTFTPTGTVTFTDGAITLGTGEVNGNGVATLTRQLGAGLHKIVASYPGNQNFEPASASVAHTADKASSTNTLTQSLTSTVFGEPFDLTSTIGVVPPAGGAPTGTVTFTDLSNRSPTIGTDTISALKDDPPSLTTSALSVGSHELTSTYGGDANFNPQTARAITHVVDKANVTFALDQSKATTVFGEHFDLAVALNAHAPGVGMPTGTVTLVDSTTGAALGTVTLDGVGGGTLPAVLGVGSHLITGAYNGDANFNSSAVQVSHQVEKAATRATLSSTSPSVLGVAVTLRVTVAVVAPGAGRSTGQVQFLDAGRAIGRPAAIINGVASIVVPSLSGGVHNITASYLGDANFVGTGAARVHTVTCTRTVTGNLEGYRIAASGTTCITSAASKATMTVPAGARVSIVDSRLAGLTMNARALALVLCGSTATTVNATRAAGPVVLGDDLRSACSGNQISAATLSSNTKGVTMFANTVSGNVALLGTTGGPTLAGANSIGGTLRCANNNPDPNNLKRPNTSASRTGECAAPSF